MTRELRIGLFVGGTALILATFIFIVGDMSVLFKKKGFEVYAEFETAAGLDKRAPVKMAGVGIGYVRDIKLSRLQARVVLAIDPGTEIPRDSRATFSNLGLLGEKYVEIVPGKAAEMCRPGDILPGFKSVGFEQVGELLVSISDKIKGAGQAIAETLGPEARANLNRTLENLAATTTELRDLVGRNQADIRKTVEGAGAAVASFETSVGAVSTAAQDAIRLLKDIAAENRDGIKGSLEKVKDLIGKIEESLRLLNASLEKINRGEGTVGKLIQDPDLYAEAKQAVEDVRRTVRSVSALKPAFDLMSGYFPKSELIRSEFNVGLWVTPRIGLQTGLVRDPRRDATGFSLQAGYRLGGFVARAGFIESEFGVGMDYRGKNDRWRVTLEGFDFNRAPRPRFRTSIRVFPVKYVYLLAGADDFALAAGREFFFGLGVGLR